MGFAGVPEAWRHGCRRGAVCPRCLCAGALGRRGVARCDGSLDSIPAVLQLNDFLLPHRYAAVMRALAVQRWRAVGPPNIRNYRLALGTADNDAERSGGGILPDEAKRLFRFLTGHNFRCLCGALTTGDPAALGPVHGAWESTVSSPHLASHRALLQFASSAELRAFGPGDYTLLSDPEYLSQRRQRKAAAVAVVELEAGAAAGDKRSRRPPAPPDSEEAASPVPSAGTTSAVLDATLCFCAPPSSVGDADALGGDAGAEEADGEDPLAWPAVHGGHVTYLTGDEELLTVLPRGNALSLVALEPGVLSFVKLVSRAHAGAAPRYDAALRFAAPPQASVGAAAPSSHQRDGLGSGRNSGAAATASGKKVKRNG